MAAMRRPGASEMRYYGIGAAQKQPPRANRDGCYAVISLLTSWQELLLQELLQELPERP